MFTVLLLGSLLSFKFKSTHGTVPLPTLHHVNPLPSARTAPPWAFLGLFFIYPWWLEIGLLSIHCFNLETHLFYLWEVFSFYLSIILSFLFALFAFLNWCSELFHSLSFILFYEISPQVCLLILQLKFLIILCFFFSFWEHILILWFVFIVSCSCWIDCVAFLTSLIMFGVVLSAPCIDSSPPPIFLFWFVFG